MYIDAHSHLQFSEFDFDRHLVLERMKKYNVLTLTVGTYLKSSKSAVSLVAQFPELMRAVIGLHPIYASNSYASETEGEEFFNESEFDLLYREYHDYIVGIGECGLDYFHVKDSREREKQKENFEVQIFFAQKKQLPLMLHIRPSKGSMDAYHDALDILSHYPDVYGDVHFFAGNIDIARKFLEKNFLLSFTGVITFVSSFSELVSFVPLERILSETDAPYVAPSPYRGKRNEPFYVREIVRRIAEIKKISEENVQLTIAKNFTNLFSLNIDENKKIFL